MDNLGPQSSGAHLPAGHEEGDFRVHGIVLFLVVLVLSGIMTFIAAWGLLRLFEWVEQTYIDKPPTPVQRQLNEQRGELAGKEGLKSQPDWYDRAVDEKVLDKTFAAPRLQEDDAADMGYFLKAEQDWLNSTGKNPDGSIHIPIDRAIDQLAQKGLPPVNGTFTPQPPLGALESVADAAKRRVSEATQTQPANSRKK
jgi:hypothetical protein